MFQAQVIQGDSLEFNALVYPTQHHNTIQYIRNGLTNLPSTLTDQAKNLFQGAFNYFKDVNSSLSKQRALNAISSISNFHQENTIYLINNIESARQASLTMQRYLMAESSVRELYHNQQCDGYSDTYVDLEPNAIGADHYEWRRVMSGVVDYESEDKVTTMYWDEIRDGDRELGPFEQLLILDAWEFMRIAVSQMNEDPTNPLGGSL